MSVESDSSASDFSTGLAILLLAQFMSAFMGAYTEDTYSMYGASWTENLFYSHLLSLPLFLPLAGTLQHQYQKLAATPPINVRQYIRNGTRSKHFLMSALAKNQLLASLFASVEDMPQGILFLLTNAVTQLACISGVNLLSAKSSAVTVTIVLNIRKLVSFIFSTLLFGHQLSTSMIIGSTLVFGSGALYGWETSWRLPRDKKSKATSKRAVS